jgi:hypothetical protein
VFDLADYHTSDCLWDRLIDWELSIWVNRDSFSSVIFPTHAIAPEWKGGRCDW